MSVIVEKPFLSIKKQIAKLKSQGLNIRKDNHTYNLLLTHSYYAFVNGYCDLLIKSRSPRVFKDGAKFSELEAIHDFDTGFRRFLFPQILYIEAKIKANCIYSFCGKKDSGNYLYPADKYLDISSYDTLNAIKLRSANKLIDDFNSAISTNLHKRNGCFIHANSNYGYIPFWILATDLSFGQVSRFYECIRYDIRSIIAQSYNLDEKDLKTVLKILSNIRNACAHNNRVYISYIPEILSNHIGLGSSSIDVDHKCDHKFGSILYALKFLLSAKKFKKITDELGKELSRLKTSLSTIKIQDVLLKMGISSKMISDFCIKIE